MLARLSLAIVVSIALSSQQTVGASPITYDFTGNLGSSDQPNPFSGSFTTNGDPTVPPATPWPTEFQTNVSITVNVWGLVLNFVNTGSLNLYALPPWQSTGSVPEVELDVMGLSQTETFVMTFYGPTADDQLANLRNLSFPLDSSSVDIAVYWGTTAWKGEGSITSIELVSAPEPSTLAIFSVLGIAAMVHRRCRRS